MQSNLKAKIYPDSDGLDESVQADSAVTRDYCKNALEHFTSGNYTRAQATLALALAENPEDANALHLMGLICYEQGDPKKAVELLRQSVKVNPDSAAGYSDLATILKEQGRLEEALHACMTAISRDPKYHPAYSNLGKLYRSLGKLEEAAACYQCAVEIVPEYAKGHVELGLAYLALGRSSDALKACETAAVLSPDDTDVLFALGKALRAAGKIENAIALYKQIDTRYQGHALALCNLASCYAETGKIQKALATHRRSLELAPHLADTHVLLGDTFRKLGRYMDALNCYQYAAASAPDNAVAHASIGLAQSLLGNSEAAIKACQNAIGIDAALPAAYVTIAEVLAETGQLSEALSIYGRAFTLNHDNIENLSGYYQLSRNTCEWDRLGEIEDKIRSAAGNNRLRTSPSALRDMACSAEELLLGARSWAKNLQTDSLPLAKVSRRNPQASRKINLGYLYGNLRNTNMVGFFAATIKNHDRNRFQITGFCYGLKEGNERRASLDKAFDNYIDISQLCHIDAARQIHEADIDILVDIEGYSAHARTGILAYRPAPVQVSYLGHPATMGASFIDYIIGDAFITPLDQQPFFDEKIVQLPDCFIGGTMPDNRLAKSTAPNRSSYGLPEKGIVFCCFNPCRTISRDCFTIWMNIIKNVPGSVLWLLDANPVATRNLKHNAAKQGVDPTRLIFAAQSSRDEHLLRLPLADLYLDTMPSSCSAAVTDALAAGVPVLTCAGETMPSRMTGSLLHSCKLNDMITYASEHYDHIARHLTRNPKNLSELRNRLSKSREAAALFNLGNYQCGLDAAYEHMAIISNNGEQPYAFAVALGEEAFDSADGNLPAENENEQLLLEKTDAASNLRKL